MSIENKDLRIAILQERENFTSEQQKRRIHHLDVIEAAIAFGLPVAIQLQKDRFSGYKAWDSFSMILQSEALLPTPSEAVAFKDWALKQIEKRWMSE